MNYYAYKAIDPDGAMLKGIAEGDDISAIYEDLAAKGLNILDVKKTSRFLTELKRGLEARKIKRKDVIEFANNLAVLQKAGVPILTALNDIAFTIENPRLKRAMTDMVRQVEGGMQFSEAVAMCGGLFPDVFVRLVKIGEETGRLDKSLVDVAEHLQRMEDLAQAIQKALIYPVFAIVTTMGALIFWLAYVLPKIMVTMKEMGVKLPLITRVLLVVSDFTQAYWYFIPLLPAGLFIAVQFLKRSETGALYIDSLKLKLPIVSLVVYNKLLTVFSEQMRILIVAGLTIDRAFDIMSEVIGNLVFRRAIEAAKESIVSGGKISDALREHKIFPSFVTRMVDIGETSGSLDEQFGILSEHYLKKLDDISEKMGKMIEPIVITVIGGMFAVIMVGLMLPLYSLISTIGKG